MMDTMVRSIKIYQSRQCIRTGYSLSGWLCGFYSYGIQSHIGVTRDPGIPLMTCPDISRMVRWSRFLPILGLLEQGYKENSRRNLSKYSPVQTREQKIIHGRLRI
jgi:hypothetical protein